MSAADEFRLLALTVPVRDAVATLDVPEDARCVLVWLEEHAHGDVCEHLDVALAINVRDKAGQYAAWVSPTLRMAWLLHYVALCGPAHLVWPERPQGLAPWLTDKTLEAFLRLNVREGNEDASTVAEFWGSLLESAGSRPNTYTPRSPLHEHPLYKALSVLEILHSKKYDIFDSGFFPRYAMIGLPEQKMTTAATLRLRQ